MHHPAKRPNIVSKHLGLNAEMQRHVYRLSDLVGADVGLHVGKNFLESFPERTYSGKLIVKLNEAKRLGEKSGSGFYQYDAKRKAKPDPALAPIVEASRKVGRIPLPEAA